MVLYHGAWYGMVWYYGIVPYRTSATRSVCFSAIGVTRKRDHALVKYYMNYHHSMVVVRLGKVWYGMVWYHTTTCRATRLFLSFLYVNRHRILPEPKCLCLLT